MSVGSTLSLYPVSSGNATKPCLVSALQERGGSAGCHCTGCAQPPGQQAQHAGSLCPWQPSQASQRLRTHAAHEQRLLQHAGCLGRICGAQDDCWSPECHHQAVRPVTAAASVRKPGPQEHCGHARAPQCCLKPGKGFVTAQECTGQSVSAVFTAVSFQLQCSPGRPLVCA